MSQTHHLQILEGHKAYSRMRGPYIDTYVVHPAYVEMIDGETERKAFDLLEMGARGQAWWVELTITLAA